MKIKVGVIFGGESVEHEVSIISAVQAMYKMNAEKYEIIPIYITKEREWYTGEILKDIETFSDMDLLKRYAKNVVLYFKNGRFILQSKGFWKRVVADIDLAFPIVHGTNVEDGVLQGYLQSIGIPFVGSDVYASVVGQDKVYMKQIFESEGIPIPKYTWFYDSEYLIDENHIIEDILNKLKFPMIIKPATLGSSIGIHPAHDEKELIAGIEDAIRYDSKVIVEEMVQNLAEVNISVLGNYEQASTSEIEEVITKEDFLTFEDKYIGSGAKKGFKGKKAKGMLAADRLIPATIDDKLKEEVRKNALAANRVLGTSGVSRIDFLVDRKAKKVYINEVNSIPGSLAFYLWEAKRKDYTELLDDMISLAIKDYKKRISKTHSFKNNILSGYTSGSKGLKGLKGLKK